MRMVIGRYEGFCQMGESLSFMSWYPLSRKFCPKLFSSGHAVWQAEQGRSYFRAKAGMARTRFTGRAEMGRVSLRTIAATIAANINKELSTDHFAPRLRFKNHLTISPPVFLFFDQMGLTFTLGILMNEALLSRSAGR